ncbi:DUF4177 domain-containing protein [Falsigemmobacter faecalis]|uniref:DUF4177 domain-containing protein n=1 Tax=Falsigemmobacter faecalis TaxID=2488730 RepID=A0A3P3DV95_9RHOB|nr:DUF4177 domain-containing protein [Falsigemmobacter faecalis]RRH77372.1 DUF4177 domain-containing protein [Falsigemmobacter faecalis]
MQTHEYKVVPAPRKGDKARGLKSAEDRFAYALTRVMNEMALDGWEYLRTDTLPVEERTGLTGRVSTSFQSLLVFRRALKSAADAGPAALRAVMADPVAPPPLPAVAPAPVPPATAPAVPPPAPVAAPSPRLNTQSDAGPAPLLGSARD